MSVRKVFQLLFAVSVIQAITIVGNNAWAQSKALPPPSLADFAAPFEDPLNAYPNHSIQHPENLFTNKTADCLIADQITQSHSPELAVQRFKEHAQEQNENGQPILSLQMALDLGLCHNPQVRMTWSDIKLQASKIGQARAAYFPQLNVSIMPQRSIVDYSNQGTVTTESTSGNIGVSWRILDFGIRSATLESAYHQMAGAIHSQNETLQKSIIAILQTYYDALTQKSQWQARIQMQELAEQTLASAKRRLKNGAGSQNDVLQAQSSLSKAKLEVTTAYGNYQKTLASLIFQLGLPANTPIELDDTLEQDMQAMLDTAFNSQQKILVEQGLQEWLDQARLAHPSIAAAKSRWMSAQSDVKAVSAQGLPTIEFGANHYRNGRPTDSASRIRSSETSVSLTVNIPLFSGFEHTYRVRGAQAQAERAKLEVDAIEQQVMLELIHTHADAQAAWHNLEDAENFYNSAALASESSRRQFENGVVDITQVIQAQGFLIEAKTQKIEAYAQWQIAKMTLIVQSYAW